MSEEIRFAPNQKLPDGYSVIRIDDHYMWFTTHDFENYRESMLFCNRWDARRSAFLHDISKEAMP